MLQRIAMELSTACRVPGGRSAVLVGEGQEDKKNSGLFIPKSLLYPYKSFQIRLSPFPNPQCPELLTPECSTPTAKCLLRSNRGHVLSPRIWTPPPSPPLNSEWPRLRTTPKLKWHVKTWGYVDILNFGLLTINFFIYLFLFIYLFIYFTYI
jgi:hypothetical protein